MSNIFITSEYYFFIQMSNTIFLGGIGMDAIKRIDELMKERNWSDYKLSLESGLSSSTIANIHRRNTIPSIATLEAICSAFGITLSQFFSDETDNYVHLSKEQQEFFKKWITLTKTQKNLVYNLINEFK